VQRMLTVLTQNGRFRGSAGCNSSELAPERRALPWGEWVETLAREIAGPGANAETQELARQVAGAQVNLHRVHYSTPSAPV
jgi:hypothetical protein